VVSGLDGNTPKERALADMIFEQQNDVRNSYVGMIYGDYVRNADLSSKSLKTNYFSAIRI
jgi:hypothetical protein